MTSGYEIHSFIHCEVQKINLVWIFSIVQHIRSCSGEDGGYSFPDLLANDDLEKLVSVETINGEILGRDDYSLV